MKDVKDGPLEDLTRFGKSPRDGKVSQAMRWLLTVLKNGIKHVPNDDRGHNPCLGPLGNHMRRLNRLKNFVYRFKGIVWSSHYFKIKTIFFKIIQGRLFSIK